MARQQIAQLESLPGQPYTPSGGLLVLSKYQSSASVLEGALKVDPRALGETKDALKFALDATAEEVKALLYADLSFVTYHTLPVWAHTMLSELKSASKATRREMRYSVGLGSELSIRNFGEAFESFIVGELYKSYRGSHKRLIVLSGDILYRLHEQQETEQSPDNHLHKLPIPEALFVNESNTVFVVTRCSKDAIDTDFENTSFVGLGAEHGFYCRWPADKLSSEQRQQLTVSNAPITGWQSSQQVSNQWRSQILHLMELFCKVTPSTRIEVYEHSLRWHYAQADPEFGFQQSRSMEEFIVSKMALDGVDITRGRTETEQFLEVRTKGVSNGAF